MERWALLVCESGVGSPSGEGQHRRQRATGLAAERGTGGWGGHSCARSPLCADEGLERVSCAGVRSSAVASQVGDVATALATDGLKRLHRSHGTRCAGRKRRTGRTQRTLRRADAWTSRAGDRGYRALRANFAKRLDQSKMRRESELEHGMRGALGQVSAHGEDKKRMALRLEGTRAQGHERWTLDKH